MFPKRAFRSIKHVTMPENKYLTSQKFLILMEFLVLKTFLYSRKSFK